MISTSLPCLDPQVFDLDHRLTVMRLTQKLRAYPNDVHAAVRLAEILIELDRTDEALPFVRYALDRSPENERAIALFRALAITHRLDPEEVKNLVDKPDGMDEFYDGLVHAVNLFRDKGVALAVLLGAGLFFMAFFPMYVPPYFEYGGLFPEFLAPFCIFMAVFQLGLVGGAALGHDRPFHAKEIRYPMWLVPILLAIPTVLFGPGLGVAWNAFYGSSPWWVTGSPAWGQVVIGAVLLIPGALVYPGILMMVVVHGPCKGFQNQDFRTIFTVSPMDYLTLACMTLGLILGAMVGSFGLLVFLEDHGFVQFMAYVSLSVVVTVLATILAYMTGRYFWSHRFELGWEKRLNSVSNQL